MATFEGFAGRRRGCRRGLAETGIARDKRSGARRESENFIFEWGFAGESGWGVGTGRGTRADEGAKRRGRRE